MNIMKSKILFLSLIATLAVTAARAQVTRATALDAEADTSVIAALSRLAPANAQDTLAQNLRVSVNGKTFNLDLYKKGRNLVSAAGFGGDAAVQINKIIALTPNERKVLDLFELLRQQASYLEHISYAENIDPNQQRIGYSWGSKDFEVRAKPPGDGDLCTYKIHGLDCSGFIYQLFKLNGIVMPKAQCCAETERQPAFLKKYLKQFYFGNIPFQVKDMGHLRYAEMQTGDILYFIGLKGVYHIAIILANDQGQPSLYQCIGNPNRSAANMDWCTKNLSPDYGVVAKKLDTTINARHYSCVRILAAQ
jgi:cell wall-associated NlpC family hydrolase